MRKPTDKPETMTTKPLEPLPLKPKTAGRPRKLPMPPLPKFQMSELEQQWYEWIIQAYELENPDFTDTDRMQIPLVAIEYIRYLRVAGKELEENELTLMSRLHPMTNLARLMENLAVTRKARKQDKAPQEDEKKAAAERLSALWERSS